MTMKLFIVVSRALGGPKIWGLFVAWHIIAQLIAFKVTDTCITRKLIIRQ